MTSSSILGPQDRQAQGDCVVSQKQYTRAYHRPSSGLQLSIRLRTAPPRPPKSGKRGKTREVRDSYSNNKRFNLHKEIPDPGKPRSRSRDHPRAEMISFNKRKWYGKPEDKGHSTLPTPDMSMPNRSEVAETGQGIRRQTLAANVYCSMPSLGFLSMGEPPLG